MKQLYFTIILISLSFVSFSQQFSEKELLEKLDADLFVMDEGNGDGTFIVRSKTTKKWGMYQFTYDKSMPIEMIPMKYDSIDKFGVNEKFTGVYLNGKSGIYLCYFDYDRDARQTVPCQYDDYKKMTVPYHGDLRFPPITYTEEHLAVKMNGKWGWVDWFTGEVKSEFIYDTTEELPTPDYFQKWM